MSEVFPIKSSNLKKYRNEIKFGRRIERCNIEEFQDIFLGKLSDDDFFVDKITFNSCVYNTEHTVTKFCDCVIKQNESYGNIQDILIQKDIVKFICKKIIKSNNMFFNSMSRELGTSFFIGLVSNNYCVFENPNKISKVFFYSHNNSTCFVSDLKTNHLC